MRILIVDDDWVSRTKYKTLLTAYGECDEANDGEIAFQMFIKAHQKSNPYTLITMDINMPGIKGQEVVQNIRVWEQNNCIRSSEAVRILMITIKDEIKEIMTSLYAGCELFLKKPLTPDKLRGALKEVGVIN